MPRAAKLGDQILAGVRDACAARGAGVVAQIRGLGLLIEEALTAVAARA
ncbi:MAG TPA: hypothetical protein VFM55_27005 [Micromonosporaceae bacterium]|nr:hypothetical protein [Micromonosporaceae bacterium]